MPDLVDPLSLIGKGVIPKNRATDALREFDGQEANGDMVVVDEHNLSDAEADVLFRYLLGEDLDKQITVLYHGRSVPKLGGFRRGLNEAMNSGAFVVMNEPGHQPRNGTDNNLRHPIYKRIRALCGTEAAMRIIDAGRGANVSNVAALRVGVKAALDRYGL